MKKDLWDPQFHEDLVPEFPCPRCRVGYLAGIDGTLQQKRPKYVTFEMYEEDPSSSPARFILFLDCNNRTCGEVVSVSGNVTDLEVMTSDDTSEFVSLLEPVSMTPPPPIIDLPSATPSIVRKEIQLSFQLFWSDYRVSASRLRTSLERLMDHFGVTKTRIRKDPKSPTKPGKRVPLELAQRIDKLPKKIGTKDYSEILHALRVVGNLGTHGKSVPHNAILDAFQLYEIALQRLFEDKSESAKAIIKRLKAHK